MNHTGWMGKSKHSKQEQFIVKHQHTLGDLAAEGFHDQGKGVLVVRKERGMKDFGVTYLPQNEFLKVTDMPGNGAKRFEATMAKYDPHKEFVLILHMQRKAQFFIWEK